jgi:hypothetical protein
MLRVNKQFRHGGKVRKPRDRVKAKELGKSLNKALERGWVAEEGVARKATPAEPVAVIVVVEAPEPAPEPAPDPDRFRGLSRADLERQARELGIEGVEHLPRKQDVIDAIIAMGG